jgi:ABC-type glutathione transport system ATPase component
MSALLEVQDLRVTIGTTAAVRGASLAVNKGETHCLVGESGCGKSITALSVMGLLPRGARRETTALRFAGEEIGSFDERAMSRLRGDRMAMIFQEPMTSLNPAYTVGSQMTEVLRRHRGTPRAQAVDRAAELLARVGHHGAGAAAWPVSASIVGRAAPARHDRHGADVRPGIADRGRTDHGARRDGAGADPAPARDPAEGSRPGDPAHHA